jgi:hypothetical protein
MEFDWIFEWYTEASLAEELGIIEIRYFERHD